MTKAVPQHSATTSATIREVVFGVEDGMVSTLGAITGIAIGSQDLFTVILAGVVIIAVESISMGIGSYLSNRTEQDVNHRQLEAIRDVIHTNPQKKNSELERLFIRDGWTTELANQMAERTLQDTKLMVKELAFRDLNISDNSSVIPFKNAIYMYFSYIVGGIIPLFAYFYLPVTRAMPVSIVVTLLSLFLLGVATTKFTKEYWLKAGARILIFGAIALIAGYIVGELAARYN
jgi:vacuolar iron transporter family protein